jgi:hypothetical protein
MGVDRIKLLGESVLTAAEMALRCTPDGIPECSGLAWGSPQPENCACLKVIFVGIRPTCNDFPSTFAGSARVACGCLGHAVDFRIRLLRDCFPGLDERGEPPEADAVSAASANLMIDAQAMVAGLVAALRPCSGSTPLDEDDCLDVSFGPLVAVGPWGGQAGFTMTLSIEVPCLEPCPEEEP